MAAKKTNHDAVTRVRARLKAVAGRINDKSVSPEFIPYKSDRANSSVKGNTKYRPRPRDPYEALPPEADLFKRPVYKTGDGDTLQLRRPGSDHSHLKSFGNQT